MKSNSAFTYLGITDTASLKSRREAPAEEYYKAIIDPAHPGIGTPKFSATRKLYFGTEKVFSVIGQHSTEIISFVISRSLKDGTHKIGGQGSDVQGVMTVASEVLYAQNGEITFNREKLNDSISATFKFEVVHEGKTYQVSEGKLFLLATGPL
ncbi:hypothetical protein [Pseudomonas sp. B33.4]|uniref:hypothetical protein n=1 Tax=Pseudomonas sp. B33.4 TaxID=3104265 RepID=UPI002ADED491|nr:hypothetical protein [Pseudomonas sp. B33.4]